MADPVNPPSRPYHAPQRAAAAARTREAIVTAAKDAFERLGWPGATMRGIADQAGVSVKTVEALYRTKAELLKHVVDYAIAGDLRPIPVSGRLISNRTMPGVGERFSTTVIGWPTGWDSIRGCRPRNGRLKPEPSVGASEYAE